MNAAKLIGIVLIAAGVLGLAIGGFSYTKETHKANLGPIAFSVQEKERVSIPMWASIAAIVAGTGMLVFGGKKG